MGREVRWLAVVGVVLAGMVAPAMAEGFMGEVNFLIGQKYLDEDDWNFLGSDSNFDQPLAFGVEMSWGNTNWPVHIVSDVMASVAWENSSTSFGDTVVATTETMTGVRKIWDAGSTRPYIGAGVGFLSVAAAVDSGFVSDDEDFTLGYWVGGGVFWRLGSKMNIGFSLRWSKGEVTLYDRDLDAGGFQAALILGFGVGASPQN